MDGMAILMGIIVYGFVMFGFSLLLIGIFGFLFKDSDSETLRKIYDVFYSIEDNEDRDYYLV